MYSEAKNLHLLPCKPDSSHAAEEGGGSTVRPSVDPLDVYIYPSSEVLVGLHSVFTAQVTVQESCRCVCKSSDVAEIIFNHT